MRVVFAPALAVALVVAVVTPSTAQPLEYRFQTVDIPIPDGSGFLAFPNDINDRGTLVATSFVTGEQAVIATRVERKPLTYEIDTFNCAGLPLADANASSVNHKGFVTGSCDSEPNGTHSHGYVRAPDGEITLFDVPGADHTFARGINGRGHVVGQYLTPLEPNRSGLFRFHGFLWKQGRFQTIDFPATNSYTNLIAINRRGQIIGEYSVFDPATNQTLENNWFIYENGQFSTPFPPNLVFQGGPGLYLADINDDGQILGARVNGGPDPNWDGLFLFEDGVFHDIPIPAEFTFFVDVRGMNNKGQFVGSARLACTTSCRPEVHGYIAQPVKPKPEPLQEEDSEDD